MQDAPSPSPNDPTEPVDPEAVAASMASRLADVQVGLRPELEFSRHVFRGDVSYVVRDPITFQSHRLDLADYETVIQLRSDRPLREAFAALVDSGCLAVEDEERFYQFIVSLHELGFLNLPIADGDRLYRRFMSKRAAARKRRFSSVMFFRMPFVNPDAFLTRTMPYFRFAFTRPFFIAWILLQVTALVLVGMHWGRFIDQFGGFFQLQNLALMWGTMIGLKVLHEFGHAYACKNYGGHVPEMGAFFILFTPCAYVDATSAWSFSRKGQRLAVNFGGMYFELTIAALAAIGWCFTPVGGLGPFLHNIVFLASVLTVGFNVNPLMRFDGYYAMSDALEIPNLRQRATGVVQSLLKKVVLGVDDGRASGSARLRWTLCSYGAGCAIYRVTVVLSIAAVIATKFFLVGILLGGIYFGTELFKLVTGLYGYLWFSPETAAIRRRSVGLSIALAVSLIWLVGIVQLPTHVHATGVVRVEHEESVRAKTGGFVRIVCSAAGENVRPAEPVVVLEEPLLAARLDEARARVRQSEVLVRAYDRVERVRAEQERETLAKNRATLAAIEREQRRLTVTAPSDGKLVASVGRGAVGRYLAPGDWIGTIGRGRWLVEVLLDEDQLVAISPECGDAIVFRPAAAPQYDVPGWVLAVEPTGSTTIADAQFTQSAGGDIQVNPFNQEAARTFFRVRLAIDPSDECPLRHGMTGTVRLQGERTALGRSVVRRLLTFLERLSTQ